MWHFRARLVQSNVCGTVSRKSLLQWLVWSMMVATTLTLSTSSSKPSQSFSSSLPDLQAAVIVPGFLTGGGAFQPLADRLTARGIPTVTVPMPAWHWIPCLGGRSMRPVLERIDMTVRHVAAGLPVPSIQYSLCDLWTDVWANPGGISEVGGSSRVEDYPVVEPRGNFPRPTEPQVGKIALIGHSAGGWISRIYVSRSSYGGRAYCGSDFVHSVVSLGTPHQQVASPAFAGVTWVNSLPAEEDNKVRKLAVGGTGFRGDEWGGLTKGAYAFCCADGSDGTSYDGDGITPIQSALNWQGAKQLVVENVSHFCWSDVFGSRLVAPELTNDFAAGRHFWYGDEPILDQWADFLKIS